MKSPKVCVALLNYNGLAHLRYTLPSVLRLDYINKMVYVVDNASTDGSVPYLKAKFPDVQVILNKTNSGYTGAANSAIRMAISESADFILILTNDILVDSRIVGFAIQAIQADSHVGAVGFELLGKTKFESMEKFEKACLDWKELEVQIANSLDGAAMFARLAVFQNIGLFDEQYFMYAEEEDLQVRMEETGYRILRTNLPVWHNAGDLGERVGLRTSWLSTRSEIRFNMKHHGFLRGLGAAKTLLSRACNPFLPPDALNNRHAMRSRPSNLLVNGAVVFAGLIWNIINFRKTRKQRQKELNMVNHSHFADSW